MNKRVWAHGLGLVVIAASAWLGGCGFFPALNSTSTGTSGTANSGDYAYVVNQTTDTLGAFALSSGTLSAIATAYALPAGLVPATVVVSRANTFVYVGGAGAIECYTIGTGGALTQTTAGGATAQANFKAMATSPNGTFLLALDALTNELYVYSINLTTGALTSNQNPVALGSYLPTAATAAPSSVRVSPNNNYVAVALGPAGTELFAFNSTTGALTSTAGVQQASGNTDLAVQFDTTSSYLFVARGNAGTATGAVQSTINSFSIGSTGALTPVQTINSGNQPYGLELDATGAYLYAANRADSTVSGYSFSAGTLTALTGSPFASGSGATAIVRDNSGKYMVVAGLNGSTTTPSSDVTLYSFDALSAGKLDPVALAASGTDPAGSLAVAATH